MQLGLITILLLITINIYLIFKLIEFIMEYRYSVNSYGKLSARFKCKWNIKHRRGFIILIISAVISVIATFIN